MSSTERPGIDDRTAAVVQSTNQEQNAEEEMVHQSGTTDNLLRLAQAASGSVIQIPADALASLLQSLTGLQNSVTILTNELQEVRKAQDHVQVLQENVQKLQIHCGMEFYLFPKLPLEIRRMIWSCSTDIPRVVAIKKIAVEDDDYMAAIKPQHSQLLVCKEAHNEVSKKVLPLETCRAPDDIAFVPKLLFNLSTDILWLAYILDGYESLDEDSLEWLACHFITDSPIFAIALPYHYWVQELHKEDLEPRWLMRSLSWMMTEEMIIVVGDDSARNSADVVFIEPIRGPKDEIGDLHPKVHAHEIYERQAWDNGIISWEMVEQAEMQYLKHLQVEREAARKAYFLSESKCIVPRDLSR